MPAEVSQSWTATGAEVAIKQEVLVDGSELAALEGCLGMLRGGPG